MRVATQKDERGRVQGQGTRMVRVRRGVAVAGLREAKAWSELLPATAASYCSQLLQPATAASYCSQLLGYCTCGRRRRGVSRRCWSRRRGRPARRQTRRRRALRDWASRTLPLSRRLLAFGTTSRERQAPRFLVKFGGARTEPQGFASEPQTDKTGCGARTEPITNSCQTIASVHARNNITWRNPIASSRGPAGEALHQ